MNLTFLLRLYSVFPLAASSTVHLHSLASPQHMMLPMLSSSLPQHQGQRERERESVICCTSEHKSNNIFATKSSHSKFKQHEMEHFPRQLDLFSLTASLSLEKPNSRSPPRVPLPQEITFSRFENRFAETHHVGAGEAFWKLPLVTNCGIVG